MPLNADRRKQLDDIVVKLADQNAPAEDVHAIVADFTSKYGNEQAAPQEGLGSKLLSAAIPSSNEPLPDSIDQKLPVYNMQTHNMEFKPTGQQAPLGNIAKTAVGVARVASDITSIPKRAIGAATGQAEGDTFLKRMADPESGLLRSARQAIAQSDAPMAMKILGTLGAGIAEDPLTYLAGIVKASQIGKYNANVLPKATQGLKISGEVADASAMQAGRKGVSTGVVSGIPFSRGQQAALTGETMTPDLEKIAQSEANIRKNSESVWNQFIGDQQDALGSKVESMKAKNSFSDQAPSTLMENVISKVDDAYLARKGEYKVKYDQIEKAAAETPSFNNEALNDAKSTMDDLGVYPVRKGFDANGNATKEPMFTQNQIKDGKHTSTESVRATEQYRTPDQRVTVNGVMGESNPRFRSVNVEPQTITTNGVMGGPGNGTRTGTTAGDAIVAAYERGSDINGVPNSQGFSSKPSIAHLPGSSYQEAVTDANGNQLYDFSGKSQSGTVPGQTIERPAFDTEGKPLYKDVSKTTNTVEFITSDYAFKKGMTPSGVSDKVGEAMMTARKMIDTDASYLAIKDARGLIGHHIGEIYKGKEGYGFADLQKLKLAYHKLSNAMETHIMASGGGENGNAAQAVADWKIADKMSSGRDDFAFLKRVLHQGKNEESLPEEALKRITNSANPKNHEALLKLKSMESDGIIPQGTTHNLQNALFNDLIEKSSRIVNGKRIVDGELLMKHANNIRPTFYNEVFTNDQADDVAQLVLEGMAQKLSNKMKIIESNPNAASKMIGDAGRDIGMWALMRGGPKGWLKWRAGKLLTKALLTQGDREATRYIRSVDQKSLVAGLFRPVAASGALQPVEQGGQAMGQATASPADQIPQ